MGEINAPGSFDSAPSSAVSRDKSVGRSAQDDKAEGNASNVHSSPTERTAGPSTSLRSGRDDNFVLVAVRVPRKNRHPIKKSQLSG